jgi:hypothetical protein
MGILGVRIFRKKTWQHGGILPSLELEGTSTRTVLLGNVPVAFTVESTTWRYLGPNATGKTPSWCMSSPCAEIISMLNIKSDTFMYIQSVYMAELLCNSKT